MCDASRGETSLFSNRRFFSTIYILLHYISTFKLLMMTFFLYLMSFLYIYIHKVTDNWRVRIDVDIVIVIPKAVTFIRFFKV